MYPRWSITGPSLNQHLCFGRILEDRWKLNEMRTLVLVGRLKPELGGCRRLPLLPIPRQSGRLINVFSGRLQRWRLGTSYLDSGASKCMSIWLRWGETFAGRVQNLVHTLLVLLMLLVLGRPGLVSLAFQPPTTDHQPPTTNHQPLTTNLLI